MTQAADFVVIGSTLLLRASSPKPPLGSVQNLQRRRRVGAVDVRVTTTSWSLSLPYDAWLDSFRVGYIDTGGTHLTGTALFINERRILDLADDAYGALALRIYVPARTLMSVDYRDEGVVVPPVGLRVAVTLTFTAAKTHRGASTAPPRRRSTPAKRRTRAGSSRARKS